MGKVVQTPQHKWYQTPASPPPNVCVSNNHCEWHNIWGHEILFFQNPLSPQSPVLCHRICLFQDGQCGFHDGEGTWTTICICGIGHCPSGNIREGFENASPDGTYPLVQKVTLALEWVHCTTSHKERIRGNDTESKWALSGPGLSELSDRKVSSVAREWGHWREKEKGPGGETQRSCSQGGLHPGFSKATLTGKACQLSLEYLSITCPNSNKSPVNSWCCWEGLHNQA